MANQANERVGIFSQLYLSVHEALPNGSVNSTLKNILDLLGDKAELAKAADGWSSTDSKGTTQALIQAYILALLQGYRQITDWVPFTLAGSPSMPLLTYLNNYRLLSNNSFPQVDVAGRTTSDTISFTWNGASADLSSVLSTLSQGTRRGVTHLHCPTEVTYRPRLVRLKRTTVTQLNCQT